jgi:hypothetical protein
VRVVVGVAPNASTAQVEDLDGGSEDLGKIHMEGGMEVVEMEVVEMEMAGTLGSTIHVLLPTAPQISPPPQPPPLPLSLPPLPSTFNKYKSKRVALTFPSKVLSKSCLLQIHPKSVTSLHRVVIFSSEQPRLP